MKTPKKPEAASRKALILKIVGGIVLFGAGTCLGWFLDHNRETQTFTAIRASSTDYKFIDPLLLLKIPENQSFPKFQPLKDALSKYVSQASSSKHVDVSVYVRDLNESNWIGINETEKFSPASMLKVVTLITVLHQAESDPTLLSSSVVIAASSTSVGQVPQDYYPPANPVQPGQTYTVQELLSHLIIESDNTANDALSALVGTNAIKQTYNDLQVPLPDSADAAAVSPQDYSHIFRVLYSGTYLSHNLSEQALDLLSRTEFTAGLNQGVPTGTVVSHKFGERTDATTDVHELHDCGIVYYPDHPYFLCVMTKGADFPTLQGIIKDVSSITWQQMEAVYPKKG